jgi:hypothetical protein
MARRLCRGSAMSSPLDRQRRYEVAHEHLTVRLAVTAGGAVLALIGSAMPWTHGLAGAAGPVTEGLAGEGRYTAVLALGVVGCAGWYSGRPENRPARVAPSRPRWAHYGRCASTAEPCVEWLRAAQGDLEVDDGRAVDRLDRVDQQGCRFLQRSDRHPVDADRVWTVG